MTRGGKSGAVVAGQRADTLRLKFPPGSNPRMDLSAACADGQCASTRAYSWVVSDWRSDRISSALRGENPTVLARLPYQAGFVAGKAFLAYRKRGGERRSRLPDFYIGAHAAVSGYRLLTRDAARYRTYFSSIELIAP